MIRDETLGAPELIEVFRCDSGAKRYLKNGQAWDSLLDSM
jgi:hypothetical protein